MPSSGGEERVMSLDMSPGVLLWEAEFVELDPNRVDIVGEEGLAVLCGWVLGTQLP